jgi:hypothetical protein
VGGDFRLAGSNVVLLLRVSWGPFGFEGAHDVAKTSDQKDDEQRVREILKHLCIPPSPAASTSSTNRATCQCTKCPQLRAEAGRHASYSGTAD